LIGPPQLEQLIENCAFLTSLPATREQIGKMALRAFSENLEIQGWIFPLFESEKVKSQSAKLHFKAAVGYDQIKVIGGGLSGCEAALQLADGGTRVECGNRPRVTTPAHKTGNLAELVCSNSFKGLALTSAHGLFKEELRRMGSRLIALAVEPACPGGRRPRQSMRTVFRRRGKRHRLASAHLVRREEAGDLDPGELTLIASGPLSPSADAIAVLPDRIGAPVFFDSIAPVVELDSLIWIRPSPRTVGTRARSRIS